MLEKVNSFDVELLLMFEKENSFDVELFRCLRRKTPSTLT